MSDKTEQPSPKRLRDARRKGQIPRSRLLSSSAVTLAWDCSFCATELTRMSGPDVIPELSYLR